MSDRDQKPEEMQVEEALRHFRTSVHAWSEQELVRDRSKAAQRSGWYQMMAPAMGWGLAMLLAVAAVTVPVSARHERQAEAARLAAQQEQQRQAAATAAKLQATSIDDEELLSHVDSDIAQSTPDAMEPLASLMSDTGASTNPRSNPSTNQ